MATAYINGRRMNIPPVATAEDIRRAGGIGEGRTIVHRKPEGNFDTKTGRSSSPQAHWHLAPTDMKEPSRAREALRRNQT